MFVKIKSKNKIISKKAKLITNVNEQAIGLMFYKSGDILMDVGKEGIWNAAIHTWFCRPLSVVWLDKNKRVVDVACAKPWRIYVPKKPARYVFETTEKNFAVKIGAILKFSKMNNKI